MSISIIKKNSTTLNSAHLTNNLRHLMQKNGIDATELSKSTGIALTTINGLKRGIGNPTLSTLQTIAEFFNITLGQLTEHSLSAGGPKNLLTEIPLLDIQEIPEFLSSSDNFKTCLSIEADRNNLFAVKITNNFMAPIFEKGTIFIVSPDLQPQDGDIVLVEFNNQLPCFRKIFIEGEACLFSPVSEIIGSEIFKSKNFIIHGTIIKAIQNFHG